jgi:hypothetical protein
MAAVSQKSLPRSARSCRQHNREKRFEGISWLTVEPEDLVSRLIEGRTVADQGDTIDVTNWAGEQTAKRLLTDYGRVEKLVQIAATVGVEAGDVTVT